MNTRPIALPLRRMLWASYRAWWGNFSVRMRPPGPMLLQWLWTGVFCVQIALVLTGVAWAFNDGRISAASVFWTNLQVSLCVGYTIHTLFYASGVAMHRQQINPDRFAPVGRAVYYAGVPLLGTGLGVALFLTLRGYNPLHALLESPRTVLSMLAISVSISGFLFFVWLSGERKRLLEAAAAQSKVQTQLLERQAAEAQLRALQAQIEPHFLFNTLATVVSLIDYDAPKAKAMLEAFIDYLRATLSGSRRGQATVGDELELVERYLQLLAIRMGPRLRVSITADATARAQPLPPLTLQPLVENAVQHGIEPLVGEGDICISAQCDALGTLTLSVLDTGVGLGAAPPTRRGAGVALQNIRERLAAHYGTRAQLRLEAVQPHGTLATLTLSAEAHA